MMRGDCEKINRSGENTNSENPTARLKSQSADLYQNPLCTELERRFIPEYHTQPHP